LGDKRVFWVHSQAFVVNIVFGCEQAVALTSVAEEGFIASHRFPMFVPVEKKTDLNFLLLFFLRKRGKYLLELASPGGAGRNKTLGQSEFAKLDVTLPTLPEQQKITAFVGVVDKKLEALRHKRKLLQNCKRGLMQKIFSQKLRFKADDGAEFPEWKKKRLGDFLVELREQVSANTDLPIYSSSREGLKLQRDYFDNREVINEGEYGVVPYGYFTYRHMSDDITFKFNINYVAEKIAVSKEYPVFRAEKMDSIFLLNLLNNSTEFKRFAATQKLGGTRTRLYYKNLCGWKTFIPALEEQQKIADFLSAIDAKIDAVAGQIEKMEQFKKGLLQQMFV
jgi:type I restriction enzyme S subunit